MNEYIRTYVWSTTWKHNVKTIDFGFLNCLRARRGNPTGGMPRERRENATPALSSANSTSSKTISYESSFVELIIEVGTNISACRIYKDCASEVIHTRFSSAFSCSCLSMVHYDQDATDSETNPPFFIIRGHAISRRTTRSLHVCSYSAYTVSSYLVVSCDAHPALVEPHHHCALQNKHDNSQAPCF